MVNIKIPSDEIKTPVLKIYVEKTKLNNTLLITSKS